MNWSRKAVDLGGTPEMKEQLAKELDSYKQHKPWREETPPNIPMGSTEDDDDADSLKASSDDDATQDATADDAAPSESSLDKADAPRKPARR